MRLLIVNHHRTLVGGVETYLGAVMPELAAAGHEMLFLHEVGAEEPGLPIPMPKGVEAWAAGPLEETMARLRKWGPEAVYLHAMHDLDLEGALIGEFPAVAFAHGYYGLCISGTKTWKRAPARPCGKAFGWKCLGYFHLMSCGGSSPVTMARDFARQSRQLGLLRRCEAVLTHPGPMEREYLAQGIARERLVAAPHFVEAPKLEARGHGLGEEARLIFVGRFDELKGGGLLIEALPRGAEGLKRTTRLDLVGDGPAAGEWKAAAGRARSERVKIDFHGWMPREAKDGLVAESDLLVAPSVWPEPFGQVGLEAAALGVPAVAFDVGGISAWLRDGVNGRLAPGEPPTSEGLAEAIRKTLGNPDEYARLRDGAREVAGEFSAGRHVGALNATFEMAVKRRQ